MKGVPCELLLMVVLDKQRRRPAPRRLREVLRECGAGPGVGLRVLSRVLPRRSLRLLTVVLRRPSLDVVCARPTYGRGDLDLETVRAYIVTWLRYGEVSRRGVMVRGYGREEGEKRRARIGDAKRDWRRGERERESRLEEQRKR